MTLSSTHSFRSLSQSKVLSQSTPLIITYSPHTLHTFTMVIVISFFPFVFLLWHRSDGVYFLHHNNYGGQRDSCLLTVSKGGGQMTPPLPRTWLLTATPGVHSRVTLKQQLQMLTRHLYGDSDNILQEGSCLTMAPPYPSQCTLKCCTKRYQVSHK